MSTDEIRHLVLDALAEVAPEADPAALDPTIPVAEQLDLDSMDFLSYMSGIAERTGIEVPEVEYRHVATLDGCIAYLQGALAAA